MNKNDEYTEVLRQRLTEKRFVHSLNVASCAEKLAVMYGENPEKAYTVGLVHDCCKDMPSGLQLSYMIENGTELSKWEINVPKLYHAMSGRIFAEKEFGITDEDMLNAVRYHTTGRKNMSLLEKIVFIADFISDERDYDGVEVMREKAKRSLDEAIVEGLSFTIKELINSEKIVHPDTLDAYNNAVFNVLINKSGESK